MKSSLARVEPIDVPAGPEGAEPAPPERPAPALRIVARHAYEAAAPTRADAARHLAFVRRIAARVARRLPPHVALDDLVSAGMVGLLEALDRFDPARGRDFESYAEFRVKGAMLDDLRRSDLMARDARLASKAIEREIARIAQELGREPEEEEIAARLGCPVEDLRETFGRLGHVRVFFYDDLDEAARRSYEAESDEDGPYRQTLLREMRARLRDALPRLGPRHRMALSLYYLEQLQLREIGEILGVSGSRVSQIISEAIHHLRAMLAPPEPADEEK